jgi:hypothetical protein
MTTRFISAAEMMCRVLGTPNYKFVAIGHPISSASRETLAEYARATVDQAWHLLLRGELAPNDVSVVSSFWSL